MKIYISLFITIFLFQVIKSETVTGSYRKGNKSVAGLLVSSNTGKKTKTDKKGRFKLKGIDTEKDTLFFESFNSKTIVVPLSGNSIVEIKADSNSVKIDLRKPESRPSALYGGNIFTEKELEQTGETNLLKAILVRVPQVAPSSFLQSGTPLYFIDGMETLNIDYLSVNEVSHVEVVKASNAASMMFGARGANGAILVSTKVKTNSTLK